MDQTEQRDDSEVAALAAGERIERDRQREAWSEFANQVRQQWTATADTIGDTLIQAGRQIQRSARTSNVIPAPALTEKISEAGQLAQAQLAGAAGGLATVLGVTARQKQKDLKDATATLSDAAGNLGKKWSDKTMNLTKTFGRNRKQERRLAKAADSLTEALQDTSKMASKQISAATDSLTGMIEDTTKRIRRRQRRNQIAAAGMKYMMLARLGAQSMKAMKNRQMKMATRSRSRSSFPWFGAAALGAGAMYLFDPDLGAGRRDRLRNRFMEMTGASQQTYGMRGEVTSYASGSGNGSMGGQPYPTWAPPARMATGIAGGLLTVSGVMSGGLMGIVRSVLGLGLLALGVTVRPGSMTAGERPVDMNTIAVDKSIKINAPVNEVYNFWRHFENFPRFMSHVVEVRDLGNNRSHWVVEGPAGTKVSWDAKTTRMVTNTEITWQSEPGSTVSNGGRVSFSPLPDGATQVNVHMTYSPPAGVIGQSVASFFGSNAKQQMDDDLARFKSLIEASASRSSTGTVETSTSTSSNNPS